MDGRCGSLADGLQHRDARGRGGGDHHRQPGLGPDLDIAGAQVSPFALRGEDQSQDGVHGLCRSQGISIGIRGRESGAHRAGGAGNPWKRDPPRRIRGPGRGCRERVHAGSQAEPGPYRARAGRPEQRPAPRRREASGSVGLGGFPALGVVGVERSELSHDVDEHARRPAEGEEPRDGDDRPQLPPAQGQPDGPLAESRIGLGREKGRGREPRNEIEPVDRQRPDHHLDQVNDDELRDHAAEQEVDPPMGRVRRHMHPSSGEVA